MDYTASIIQLSDQLDKFKKSGDYYTFRCPICGDSSINSYKTRGYLFKTKNDNYAYKCHNCGVSKSYKNFLKDHFPHNHQQLIYSKYKQQDITITKSRPVVYKPVLFDNVPTIKELHKNHTAKLYLAERKAPPFCYSEFFYVKNFKAFTNSHKHTYNNLDVEEERIVFPLIIDGVIVGYQGRLISGNGLRYITIMLDPYAPKIFGIDDLDFHQPIYITEGIFDSVFVHNSIAMLGSDLNVDFLDKHKNSKFVFLFDNEKYSEVIIKKMKKVVKLGHSIALFPSHIEQKDINDCVLAGIDTTQITNNVYSGLRALVEIKNWIKI
jgi:predicted RNA-binding Zn-ribbon protein involved in translation (DUF1610 family)